jgi:Tfp pilus assembly protein PilO
MAKKLQFSTKRLQISKANRAMITVIALSSFIVIFSLVASRALLNQRSYQSEVVDKQEQAKRQLSENIAATESLVAAYRQFTGRPTNILGGNPAGQGDLDGDNAKIILDALPSRYDFPALATSLEKILNDSNYTIDSIDGVDDELNQQANASSANPQPVDIPFELAVSGNYPAMQDLLSVMQRSIRPLHINSLKFTGSDNSIKLSVSAKTYYQPEKNLDIRKETVK